MRSRKQILRQLGNRARQARLAIGLTQAEVAADSGLSRGSIANVEGGRQDVPVTSLCAIASALGVAPADLISDSLLIPDPPDRSLKREAESLRATIAAISRLCERTV